MRRARRGQPPRAPDRRVGAVRGLGLLPSGPAGGTAERARPPDCETRAAVLALTAALALAAAVGAALAAGLPAAPPVPGPVPVVALTLFLGLTAALYVELRSGGQRDLLDLTEVALAPALVLLPGPLLVPLVAVAKGVALTARGLPPVKAAFNAAQWAAAAAAGTLVLTAARDPGPFTPSQLPLLLLALVAVVAVNTAATLAVVSLVRQRSPWRLLAESGRTWARASALALAVAISFGVLLVALWLWAPATTPLALVALLVLHLGSRALAAERAGQARLLGLQRGHVLLAGAVDPRPAVPAFLAQLQAAFERADAALYLTGEGGLRVVRAGTAGTPDQVADPGQARLVEALLARGGPVAIAGRPGPGLAGTLAALGCRDCLAAPVRTGGRVAGLLVLRDRAGLEGFETGEVAVLDAAASLLGQALHRGELAEAVLAEREGLRRSESRWRSLVHDAPDLLIVTDRDGRVRYASPSCERLTGRPAGGLAGAAFADLLHPGDAPAWQGLLADLAGDPGARREALLRVRAHDGTSRHVEAVVSDLTGAPAVAGIVVNARDVTERRRVESLHAGQALVLERVARGHDLAETLGLLGKVVSSQQDGMHCGVALGPAEAPVLVAEPDLPPAALAELRGLVGAALAEPLLDDEPRVLDPTPALAAAGVGVVAVHPLASGGAEPAPASSRAAVVLCHPDAEQERAFRLVADTAARLADIAVSSERTRDRLAHQAAHDALTDLPNRTVFLDRLRHALDETRRSRESVLVLFLDLDRFKVVNDSLGHAAGDALLRAVAARLRQIVRPGDTIARFGGDEFTMLCEGIRDEAHALELVERVQDALRRPVEVGGQELFVTTSIGLALGTRADTSPEVLLENADAAMYRAKERGGTSYEVFDEAMRARAQRRLAMQNALHRAIEHHQFRVVYQPTVDLRSGAVAGVEALVRWEHPEEGLLGPAEFIPLAEETGLIVPIGAQVLTEALRQAAAWAGGPGFGAAPAVSVNLSAAQLQDPGLVGTVRRALADARVPPAQVTLEITESSLMRDVEASTSVLGELKALGLRLVVDDFGTGYSSLTYLQRLPLDGLKVDRTFVAGLGSSEGDSEIVRAVLGLARSLDLVAVAEGVETWTHVRHLVDLDCDVAQGYLFGRPAPPAEVSLVPREVGAGTRAGPRGRG